MHALITGLLDFILPPVCLACDKLIAAGDTSRLICRRCKSLLRAPPSPLCERCGAPRLRTGRPDTDVCGECAAWPDTLVASRSAYLLHPPADRIVHQLKYRGWQALAPVMATSMSHLPLPGVMQNSTVVQAVPTTKSRIRERGYNQAGLIAESFAAQTGRRYVEWLERSSKQGGSSSQTTLQPAKRAANVAGAFRLRPTEVASVSGAHVLLIDDVLTTGATVSECTETLAEGGAASVCVLTYARALDTKRLLAT